MDLNLIAHVLNHYAVLLLCSSGCRAGITHTPRIAHLAIGEFCQLFNKPPSLGAALEGAFPVHLLPLFLKGWFKKEVVLLTDKLKVRQCPTWQEEEAINYGEGGSVGHPRTVILWLHNFLICEIKPWD